MAYNQVQPDLTLCDRAVEATAVSHLHIVGQYHHRHSEGTDEDPQTFEEHTRKATRKQQQIKQVQKLCNAGVRCKVQP